MSIFKTTYEVVGAGLAIAAAFYSEIDAARKLQWAAAKALGADGFRPVPKFGWEEGYGVIEDGRIHFATTTRVMLPVERTLIRHHHARHVASRTNSYTPSEACG